MCNVYIYSIIYMLIYYAYMLINIKYFIFILLLHSVWLKMNQIKTNED